MSCDEYFGFKERYCRQVQCKYSDPRTDHSESISIKQLFWVWQLNILNLSAETLATNHSNFEAHKRTTKL